MNANLILQMIYVSFAKYAITELSVNPMDLCVVRTGSLGLLALCFAIYNKKSLFRDVEPSQRKLLVFRAICGGIGYASLTFSVSNVPIVMWTLTINTSPFWTSILGYFLLKETVSRFDIACILGGFVGVVILAFAKQSTTVVLSYHKAASPVFGMACALLNALCYSGVIVLTRKAAKIHYSLVLLSYGIIATFLYVVWVLIEFFISSPTPWPRIFYYDSTQWKYLLIIAIMNGVSMTFATLAFQKGKSSFVSMIGLINVVYAFIADITIFKTTFNYLHIVGAVIITLFNIVALCSKISGEKIELRTSTKLDQSIEKSDSLLRDTCNDIIQLQNIDKDGKQHVFGEIDHPPHHLSNVNNYNEIKFGSPRKAALTQPKMERKQ